MKAVSCWTLVGGSRREQGFFFIDIIIITKSALSMSGSCVLGV